MTVKIESPHHSTRNNLSIQYANEIIWFERADKQKGNQKVLIKVHPDCSIVVKAPPSASDEEVRTAVKRRARWIYDRLQTFRNQLTDVRPRQYVSGESHYYLGKQHMLKIVVDPATKQNVKLLRGRLEISVKDAKPDKIKTLLDDWYKSRAKYVFQRRLSDLLDKTLWVKDRPSLRILSMQTQWGSCSPNGRLTLNPHLVKAPRDCIDYVILHELCHIAEHNHSERFYRLMKQVMPDWESVKKRLDTKASVYLANTVTK